MIRMIEIRTKYATSTNVSSVRHSGDYVCSWHTISPVNPVVGVGVCETSAIPKVKSIVHLENFEILIEVSALVQSGL